MKKIKLTQGLETQVDDSDFELLNKFKWFAAKHKNTFYVKRMVYVNNKRKAVYMHREILGTSINQQVDHIDHDGLNNQRNNIRICSSSQNHMNKISFGSSKYLGVFYDRKYIRAAIKINGKQISLGLFKTEKEAAIAYNKAALEHHKEFTNLNKI